MPCRSATWLRSFGARPPTWRTTLIIVAISMVAVLGIGVLGWVVGPHTFVDLAVYRLGLHQWWRGGDLYGELPPSPAGFPLPFIYPPFAAVILSPLAMVPWVAACVVLIMVSLVALVVSLYCIAGQVWRTGGRGGAIVVAALACPLVLVLDPVAQTFWFGQVNLLLMALVSIDCLADRPRWPRGVLIGIAAAIKLTPAAFVLFFVVRRDWRSCIIAVVAFVVATGIGCVFAPGPSIAYWTGNSGGISAMAGSMFGSNQAIRGVLARLPFVNSSAQVVVWMVASVVLLILAVAIMSWANRTRRLDVALVANAALALLVSPISWGHHWVYVALAMVILIGECARRFVRERYLAAAVWLMIMVSVAVVFVLHPYHFFPLDHHVELTWAWWQHVLGDAYPIITVVGGALLAGYAWRRRTRSVTT